MLWISTCVLVVLSGRQILVGSLWNNLGALDLNKHSAHKCAADSSRIEYFLMRSVTTHPSGVPPRYLIGLLYRETGEHERAIQQFEDLTDGTDGHREAVAKYWLGREYGAIGDENSQIGAWADSSSLFGVLLELAEDKIQEGDWDTALLSVKRLEQMEPQSPTAYILEAFIHQKRSDLGKAESALWQAIEVAPGNMQPYLSLANFYYSQKDYERADRWYRIAISKAPENPRPYLFRGLSYLVQGYTEQGCGCMRHAVCLGRTDPVYDEWMEKYCTPYYGK